MIAQRDEPPVARDWPARFRTKTLNNRFGQMVQLTSTESSEEQFSNSITNTRNDFTGY
jgi:hypothetical protein